MQASDEAVKRNVVIGKDFFNPATLSGKGKVLLHHQDGFKGVHRDHGQCLLPTSYFLTGHDVVLQHSRSISPLRVPVGSIFCLPMVQFQKTLEKSFVVEEGLVLRCLSSKTSFASSERLVFETRQEMHSFRGSLCANQSWCFEFGESGESLAFENRFSGSRIVRVLQEGLFGVNFVDHTMYIEDGILRLSCTEKPTLSCNLNECRLVAVVCADGTKEGLHPGKWDHVVGVTSLQGALLVAFDLGTESIIFAGLSFWCKHLKLMASWADPFLQSLKKETVEPFKMYNVDPETIIIYESDVKAPKKCAGCGHDFATEQISSFCPDCGRAQK